MMTMGDMLMMMTIGDDDEDGDDGCYGGPVSTVGDAAAQ